MTRDELEAELETLLIGTPTMVDVMGVIDSYAAAQRAEIEQQIAQHVDDRLRADRERIAQAIEAEAHRSISDSEHGGLLFAAEIVRKGGSADE